MKDKYIDGVSISKLDDEITKIATKCNDSELGGMPMLIAIQNEDGLVYRVLTTFGLGSYMEIVYAIADLGLKDLYANNMNPQKYDSLFVHK